MLDIFLHNTLRKCRLFFQVFCKTEELEQMATHPAMKIQPRETILVERKCMPKEIGRQLNTKI